MMQMKMTMKIEMVEMEMEIRRNAERGTTEIERGRESERETTHTRKRGMAPIDRGRKPLGATGAATPLQQSVCAADRRSAPHRRAPGNVR